jgi:hypothetical protein
MTVVNDQAPNHAAAPLPRPTGRVSRVATWIGPGTVTVSVSGRLDEAGDAALARHLAEARELCWGLLVVDLTACDGIGAAALAAVREAGDHAEAEGFRLSVAAGAPGIRAALDALSVRHTPSPAASGTPVVALHVCVSRDHKRSGDGSRPRQGYPFADPGRPGQRLPSAV